MCLSGVRSVPVLFAAPFSISLWICRGSKISAELFRRQKRSTKLDSVNKIECISKTFRILDRKTPCGGLDLSAPEATDFHDYKTREGPAWRALIRPLIPDS